MRLRTMILFAVGTRRLMKRAGKNAGKGLLGIKPILQTNVINLLIGRTQLICRQMKLPVANVTPQTFPFMLQENAL